MSLLEQLNKRYATKKFDTSRKISSEDLNTLLEAIRLSASSYGLQAYKVLVVENPEIRKQLRAAAYDQSQITDASQLLVFALDTNFDEKGVDHFIELTAKSRKVNVSDLSGYSDMMKGSVQRPKEMVQNWFTHQIYIALGFGLVSAAQLKLDSCPMEGFDNNKFDEILGLQEKNLHSVVLLTVGYRSPEDTYQNMPKVRLPKEELFVNI